MQVFVGIKNAVFEKSTALRSLAELLSLVEKDPEGAPPFLFALTDGGPEHRSTYASFWVALAALFVGADFDYVCFVRTCPGQSWMNFVERMMSLLNIALSGVAVMRDAIDNDPEGALEKLVQRAGSMKELRGFAEKDPALAPKLVESCKAMERVIMGRLEQVTLKGVHVQEAPVLGDEEIDAFFSLVKRLDARMEKGDTTQAKLAIRSEFLRFLKTHAVLTT